MRHSSFHLTHIFAAAACLLMTPRESSAQVFYYGNYNDLGGNSNHSPNFLLGSKYTATQPVTLLSAGVIFRTSGYMWNIGLYTNSGGLPDQLVATTGAFAVTAMGRVETPFTTHESGSRKAASRGESVLGRAKTCCRATRSGTRT